MSRPKKPLLVSISSVASLSAFSSGSFTCIFVGISVSCSVSLGGYCLYCTECQNSALINFYVCSRSLSPMLHRFLEQLHFVILEIDKIPVG